MRAKRKIVRNIKLGWQRSINVSATTGEHGYVESVILDVKHHAGLVDPVKDVNIRVFIQPDELDELLVTLVEAKLAMKNENLVMDTVDEL